MANYQTGLWAGPGNDQMDEPQIGQKLPQKPMTAGQPTSATQPYGQPVLYASGGPATPNPQGPAGVATGATPAQIPMGTVTGSTPAARPGSPQNPMTAQPAGYIQGDINNTSGNPTGGDSPWGDAGDYGGWIDQRLKDTGNTTDDPNYWRTQMSKDPKAMAGDPSAIGWWKDAIDRAEGSALVKSGQLSLRGAGGGAGDRGPAGGMRPWQGGTGNLMSGALGTGDANSLYAKLLERANQSLNLDPRTDPIIRAQTDAFDAARQRGDKNTLSSVAEQAGPNTNLEAVKRSAGEASGQATSSYQAQLGGEEVAARRQEIQQALSGATGLLTSQQQMALQEELANLDRAQNQWQFEAGLNQNESQFGRTLGQHAYEFDNNDQYRNSPLAWA